MIKVQLSLYNNSWYHSGGSSIKKFIWYFANIIFIRNIGNPSSKVRLAMLKLFGAKIGHNVIIRPGVNIKYPWLLIVGNNVWIGENVWIDNLATVKIGNNVCISQGAMLLCGNHNYKKETFDLITGNIILEDGSWVCAKSVVCPGITLHSHSILGVGSVANHDLDAYSIYQGVPATKVRERVIS
ncbi:WcaF family extracellular polysaccharide biosynthesis acetyltransferase [Bacteroides sp. 224]|uniref:WcaF family extracellular polysaccharide biosynthesis acetyltransferase n=1 Tax=Bacteroides sp. 224 TaxID=2302936 RepID=UPI0013D7BCDE|nr:WcaF family extracellular polysaccharide biosynthesis acetyltransferase [Bacteroides sp. 224]NDV66982.1 colanic acid biosynthesis acetyltransferase WcaF [Bacteroides sp. 224]